MVMGFELRTLYLLDRNLTTSIRPPKILLLAYFSYRVLLLPRASLGLHDSLTYKSGIDGVIVRYHHAWLVY
jgi:hypothetical protein